MRTQLWWLAGLLAALLQDISARKGEERLTAARLDLMDFALTHPLPALLTMEKLLFQLIGVGFVLLQVVPTDPAKIIAGADASAEVVAGIRKDLGLDRPLHEQYLAYLLKALHLSPAASIPELISRVERLASGQPAAGAPGGRSTSAPFRA